MRQLLRPPRNTRRLTRQRGKRYLIKPNHIRFSNTVNESNSNWNNFTNNNANYTRALVNSRRSIVPSTPPSRSNIPLSSTGAAFLANLTSKYNDPKNMLNALKRSNISDRARYTIALKIHEMFD